MKRISLALVASLVIFCLSSMAQEGAQKKEGKGQPVQKKEVQKIGPLVPFDPLQHGREEKATPLTDLDRSSIESLIMSLRKIGSMTDHDRKALAQVGGLINWILMDSVGKEVENERKKRSEERRVGKECTSWCRSRWSPYH